MSSVGSRGLVWRWRTTTEGRCCADEYSGMTEEGSIAFTGVIAREDVVFERDH
jgi:hypothetical protein